MPLTPGAGALDPLVFLRKSTYDPTAVEGDAFDMDQMVEGATTKILSDTERTKLAGIETAATADQTGAEIKTAYEGEANTNAYTDADAAYVTASISGQVAFPATANPSADANTLDDYEEGAWTPEVNGTAPGVTTYTKQLGRYTKVGNLVTAQAHCIWTSATGSGAFRINDLPFAAVSDTMNIPGTLVLENVTLTAGDTVTARLNAGLSIIVPGVIPSAGGAEGAITFDTAGSCFLSITYMV